MTNRSIAAAEGEDEHAHVRLVREYFSALERDPGEDELASFFAPGVRQREFPNRLVPEGAERNLELLLAGSRKGQQVVRNQRYDIRTVVARGERVAVELTWTAELKVELANTPSGGRLRANCAVFFTIREGRIAEQNNYDCFDAF